MATTSTAPALIDATLTAVGDDLPGQVQAFESWPGPDAAPEMVVLGEITWELYDIASIKLGRQRRSEEYRIGWEVFVFGPGSPTAPKSARDRAHLLATSLEDVFADRPEIGVGPGGWVGAELVSAGPRIFENTWAYRVAGNIHANARLT